MTALQAPDEIWCDVVIGTGDELQRDVGLIEMHLQRRHGLLNFRSRIVVDPRQNMWRAGHRQNALGRSCSGHIESYVKAFRAVIYSG
jgi:hypothetical protein